MADTELGQARAVKLNYCRQAETLDGMKGAFFHSGILGPSAARVDLFLARDFGGHGFGFEFETSLWCVRI